MTARDLIKVLARSDECCPPVECGPRGSSCEKCWVDFVHTLGLNLED